MRAYVSGPMTNRVGFNFDTFDAVRDAWEALGNEAVSPADRDREWLREEKGVLAKPEHFDGYATGDVPAYSAATNFKYEKAMTWDVKAVADCDAIVMLPEWEQSSGARTERYVAEVTGKKVFLAGPSGDGWTFWLDPVQKRLALSVVPAFAAQELKVS